jgi:hypothetical protein
MRCAAGLLLALAALLLLPVAEASAHTKSETHSSWQINGATVYVIFTVPEIEAKRLAKPDESTPTDEEVLAYLTPRLGASSEGKDCPTSEKPDVLSSTSGYRRLEFSFECPSGKNIQIRSNAFFDIVPSHTNFAQIQAADGSFVEQLFTQDRQTLEVSGENSENKLQNASFFEYILLGIMHIFTGVDHQAFLVGLVLISRNLRDLVFVITGFTIGHSVTLALAVTGIIRPHAEYIDALIGFTIAMVGAENIGTTTHKPGVIAACALFLGVAMAAGRWLGFGGLPSLLVLGAGIFGANYLMISGHLRDAARFRLLVTLIFGLIHGFGFAADLLQMRLPPGRLAELLVGFNTGVEIGQLTLVLVLTAVVGMLVKLRVALPRPIVVDVASSFLVGLGLFWFVSRSYAS